MIRAVAFVSVCMCVLGLAISAHGESFSEKLKNKLQQTLDKLPIPEYLKDELFNGEELKQVLKSMDMDDLPLPESVKEEMLDSINFDDILKNLNLNFSTLGESEKSFPKPSTKYYKITNETTLGEPDNLFPKPSVGELEETLNSLNMSTLDILKSFPTGIVKDITVSGENSRIDDLEDRIKTLEEDVRMLKAQQENTGNMINLTKVDYGNGGCPEGFDRNPQNGICYMFSRDRKSWKAAQKACLRLGAGLISIETQEEYDMILQYIGHNFVMTDFYTSGNDMEEQLMFTWDTTGQPITGFSAWGPNEPNNKYGQERCLEIKYYQDGQKYYWNDVPCFVEQNYICEMPDYI